MFDRGRTIKLFSEIPWHFYLELQQKFSHKPIKNNITEAVALGSEGIIFFISCLVSEIFESVVFALFAHPWEQLPGPCGGEVISYKLTSSEISRNDALFPLRVAASGLRGGTGRVTWMWPTIQYNAIQWCTDLD